MEFSRIGEHTIKCVISEEEIYDLGYTMDEIMSNGERTQEFMNQIFDMASEEFGTDFNSGIKTVRADFLAWSGAFNQSRYRKADTIRRYGREAFRP